MQRTGKNGQYTNDTLVDKHIFIQQTKETKSM
jgi:hypothetical protein